MMNKSTVKALAKTAGVALATYGVYKRYAPSQVKRIVEGG
jgi:hypothetical protein